jgi:F-type H+-transporting ATPase subunit delta
MNVRHQGAARRYARALLEVALEQGEADSMRDGLRRATELLAQHPELLRALTHPAVPADRKKAIVREVFGQQGADDTLMRLLDLLIARGRLELLPAIDSAYTAEWNARRGVLMAEAVTAEGLEPSQQERLSQALAAAAGQGVELTLFVDPRVLGGVRVTMGGRIFDGTVRGRLESLRRHLEKD